MNVKRVFTLGVLVCIVLVAVCVGYAFVKKPAPTPEELLAELNRPPSAAQIAAMKQAWTAWETAAESKKVAAELFPAATQVRVYKGEFGLHAGKDGKVMTTQFKEPGGKMAEVPASGGEVLTDEEVRTLRSNVFYVPSPPAIAMCCSPRHGFFFFDKDNKILGSLLVCYECGCAEISPQTPPDASLDWIKWDAAALRKLIEAHHLHIDTPNPQPPIPQDEPGSELK